MSLSEYGIIHKKIGDTLVSSIRTSIKAREQISGVIEDLKSQIPADLITGPAFCKTIWVSSVPREEGFDMEIGFPVKEEFNSENIKSKILDAREVLSITHNGPIEKRTETFGKLIQFIRKAGLISDEFMIEVYPNDDNPMGNELEYQFVIHNWQQLFGIHAERVLGTEKGIEATPDPLDIESPVNERYMWAKKAIENLNTQTSDKYKIYDILSSCAHVFPSDPIQKAKEYYEEKKSQMSPLEAIDEVLKFMEMDAAWGNHPYREGNIIYAQKNPANKEAFEKATTPEEKRKAACFCPILKDHLEDEDFPLDYCFCSAGWERRQWEGILSKPIRVDVLNSLPQGDEFCKFAIHIPGDLS